MADKFFHEIIDYIKSSHPEKNKLSKVKISLCKKYNLKEIPTDIQILLSASKKDFPKIKKYLITKPTRSLSGVSVVAIMSSPKKCPHGKCSMCPGGINSEFGDVPQSYTGKEPATRRAIRNDYDPYLQVMNRLEQYIVQGHVPDKIELIVMGGTFPSLPKKYQEGFITNSFKAMNDFSKLFFKDKVFQLEKFKNFFELPGDLENKLREKRIKKKLKKEKAKRKTTLEKEQALNESSNIRCVGLTLETRPDYAKLVHAEEMLRLGCTRVELGVQTVYDKVLEKIERGHSVQDSIDSTRILKDLGFKINYHVMPGLPSVTHEQDLSALKKLFDDENFQPDMLKLYPCMVLKGTKLYDEWKSGKFSPLTTENAAKLIAEFKQYVPEYVRIMRVQRDIPTFMTEAGVDKTNLRQYIEKELKKQGIKCRCIRCREIGRTGENICDYEIKKIGYNASNGKEIFISAGKNNALIGFCRLRFPSQQLRKEITKDSALIRELHVYGETVEIGKTGKIQHKGIGKKLLSEAEKIAKQNNYNKIVVISGIGVRNYYKKLGYVKEGVYMVKKI
jgi:elongator complex protein 3